MTAAELRAITDAGPAVVMVAKADMLALLDELEMRRKPQACEDKHMTKTPPFCWWMTATRAKSLGCTHHARFLGIIPGFIADMGEGCLWVPRSDALNWLEDALAHFWVTVRRARGEEPDFSFTVGRPL